MSLVIIAAFLFGLIIGSFANVFILRWGTGRSLGGRSACPSCGHRLAWHELIPVLSFLLQKGRCSTCDVRISRQYVIVELLFGFLFAVAAYAAVSALGVALPVLIPLIYAWCSVFFLLSIAVYDLTHFIIPDGMVYAYIALSFVWTVFAYGFTLAGAVTTLFSGIIIAAPLFILWAVSRGRWMGFGDVKLAVGMGMMLGLLGGASALIFAIWLGALVSLSIIAYGRVKRYLVRFAGRSGRFTMRSEIPFGPFLVAGTLFVYFTHITLLYIIGTL